MIAVAVVVNVAAAVLAGLRWLRVAQREHYLPGSASRFAMRWWAGVGPNRLLAVAVLIGIVGTLVRPLGAVVSGVAVACGPFGLPIRGTAPGPLAWTRRMRTLAAVWAALQLLVLLVGQLVGAPALFAAIGAALVPVFVDAACAIVEPLEHRLGQKFVDQAKARLRSVHPTVVAITGSYGKTSTKGYVAHLAGETRTVVASPRSFNNRAGLARAINEHLVPGTEVFIAEMGTYGPGEIAELCSWIEPAIGVITAIGPVHLERFGTEERIVEAKSEILEKADVAVLNVDDERLRGVADRLEAAGRRVIRCSAADVAPMLDGVDAPAGNVACAVAVALELGVPAATIKERVRTLPTAANRLAREEGSGGWTILDDTFNSNPAGAARALDALEAAAGEGGRRIVVTPGMVELGPRQHAENAAFARAAAIRATDLVVVGHTNRKALLDGATGGPAAVRTVDSRQQAVAWVREQQLGPGDAVLYENDRPDHYP
ncbi:MAG: UDP-N-acetylmuramoyl-tripeptide--D-alanyl-D-alanine ligase [Actinomycetota bacterium]|nr:UDP-N-acetylmuramoyl-tripeptide--D-alanyl-D-alanine ligase [Actinomycetota bacterium]